MLRTGVIQISAGNGSLIVELSDGIFLIIGLSGKLLTKC
ncbi:hypothetical protein PHOSAC3_90574 [Mesotoga infera]|nr:hypothetical protein PHOSAC3_90574 [Mesotoga infera]